MFIYYVKGGGELGVDLQAYLFLLFPRFLAADLLVYQLISYHFQSLEPHPPPPAYVNAYIIWITPYIRASLNDSKLRIFLIIWDGFKLVCGRKYNDIVV